MTGKFNIAKAIRFLAKTTLLYSSLKGEGWLTRVIVYNGRESLDYNRFEVLILENPRGHAHRMDYSHARGAQAQTGVCEDAVGTQTHNRSHTCTHT